MSVQFGRWNFEGQPPSSEYIEKVSAALAPYGPDSNESYSKDGVRILYRAFHTTKESRRETQPHISSSGAVITWDGRLDNRAELISELRDSLTISSTDVAILAAAYEKWSTNCFAKLIGDWSLSIWNPNNRSLVLAKDPIGTRHLYYSFDDNQVTWSTILDPLLRFAGKTFAICEEYIAGWFSCFPAAHLTPCVGLHSILPRKSVIAPTPNTKSISALSSRKPSSAGSVPTALSSLTSAEAWTPPPSFAWPTSSSPAAAPNLRASSLSPCSSTPTTLYNLTGTYAPTSLKSRKSVAYTSTTSITES